MRRGLRIILTIFFMSPLLGGGEQSEIGNGRRLAQDVSDDQLSREAQTSCVTRVENDGSLTSKKEALEIVVTASPVTDFEYVSTDGASSTVIGAQQIERLSAMDLPTALRQVPGVSISRYSPVGAYGGAQGGSVYIRGSGAARPGSEIKIYTDGVPRESGVWSHPLMDIAPIDFAESICVAKNPQPQHYPGTFGAVNIETKRRDAPGHEGELGLAYGRFNTLVGSVAAGGKTNRFDYYVGASYKYSGGAREHGSAELGSGFARLGWDVSPDDHLAYIFQHTDNWVRDPGPYGGEPLLRDLFQTRTDTQILRLESDHEMVSGYSLVYYECGEIRWHKDHLADANPLSPPGSSNTDWNNYGFRSSYDIWLDRLTLTGSLDSWSEGGQTWNVTDATGKRVWGFDGRFFTTAPYAGARYDFDAGLNWTLTPSVGSRYYYPSEFDDAFAPCAALTLAKNGLEFFVSYARGVHYPGIYMRGISPATWRSLEAETMDTTELGTHIEFGNCAVFHGSLFHEEVKNRMDSTPSGYLNVGEMSANGMELSLHVYPSQQLTLFVGGTYSVPETEPVSRLPDITANAGASYRITRDVRWDWDVEYVASQYGYGVRTVNPVLQEIEDHLVFNTRVSLDLQAFSSLNGEVYVSIENLTNQHYEYFPDYPMPGITWYTGVKVTF